MARLTRALLMALATAGSATAAPAESTTTTTTQNATADGLHSLMVKAGKMYFGTAIDVNNFADAKYMAIADNKNEFGMMTAENSMKWSSSEPNQGKFAFASADKVVERAKKNGQGMRCHNLIWYNQLPSYVTSGSWTNETLTAAMQTHITNVVEHFKGACYAWDVVNEAFGDGDGSYRQSVFLKNIGEAFIPLAFQAAAAADPDTKLYFNDFNLEISPDKAAATLALVKDLQARKIRIDGVGFQGHLVVGGTPTRDALATSLRQFTALGVEVAYTEVDIRFESLPASSSGLEQQAQDYAALVGSCLDVKECVGVTVWQFSDKYNWVSSVFKGKGDACLWSADYAKKPAYDAVIKVLQDAISSSGTSKIPGFMMDEGVFFW
ncbi:glycoside hydrolase [Staphylotrichum tortipilum]|uniref:Beta-xylanase n=1 Tax=Staphylotrichum tortipilum TaxID=2831512 RepID=A0AAN6MNV3_9PEZI|nr:glycoside hydrolase [Staphylotrichum longicolle]